MNYKIIFSDIDGTLLNKDRVLSPLTLRVFKQLQEQLPVVLISSRMPQAMEHLQEDLNIAHQPLICYNGGLILLEGQVISSTEIPFNILEQLADYNETDSSHLSLYNNRDWFVPKRDKWTEREENNTRVEAQVLPIKEVLEHWKPVKKGAHKIMAMGQAEKINRLENYLFENFGDYLHLYRSKDTYLEIANKEISKLTGIQKLLDTHFNYNLDECIAFGDNYNDFEMLQHVGLGIAVGNAKPEIIKIANHTTHSSKEDGVARSLQELFGIS